MHAAASCAQSAPRSTTRRRVMPVLTTVSTGPNSDGDADVASTDGGGVHGCNHDPANRASSRETHLIGLLINHQRPTVTDINFVHVVAQTSASLPIGVLCGYKKALSDFSNLKKPG